MEKKHIVKKDVIGLAALVAVISISWFLVWHFNLRDSIKALEHGDISTAGVSAPFVFVLTYIALIVALVPSAPLNIAAGALFGPVLGTFYSWIAVLVGGSISFLLARKFGESFVERFVKEKSPLLNKYNEKIAGDGAGLILLFRVIPFFPIAGFNYMFGLTRMRFRTYLWGSAVGTIPGIFILTYFGETISNFSWHKVAISALLLAIMAFVSLYYRRKQKQDEQS